MSAEYPHDQHDIEIMERTLYGEARGEGDAGMIAVAWVLRNRASRPRFAKGGANNVGSIAAVCLAPWQFSCWNANDPNSYTLKNAPSSQFAAQRPIALGVLNGDLSDPTEGADHYFATSIPAPDWAASMKKTVQIGHHVFYDSRYPA